MRVDQPHAEGSSSPILRLLSAIRSKRERRHPDLSRPPSRRVRRKSVTLKDGRWPSELGLMGQTLSQSPQLGSGPPEVFLVPMAYPWPSPAERTRRLTTCGGSPQKIARNFAERSSNSAHGRRRSLSDLDGMRELASSGRLGRPFERGTPLRRSRETQNLTSGDRRAYDERVLVVGSRRDTRIRFPSRCGPVFT